MTGESLPIFIVPPCCTYRENLQKISSNHTFMLSEVEAEQFPACEHPSTALRVKGGYYFVDSTALVIQVNNLST